MDTMPQSERPEQVRALAEQELDRAMGMNLGLSEDDSVYGLTYIGQKLTQCAAGMEVLGDMSIRLSKISLEVTRAVSGKRSHLLTKERQYRSDPKYLEGDRNEKTGWLQGKLEVFRIELEDWELTHQFLAEIRGAVNERIQLFKRLDSDIRLQHKLLEAKVAAGVVGTFPSGEAGKGGQGSRFPLDTSVGVSELEID